MVIETLHRLKRASFASLMLLLLKVAYPVDARILLSVADEPTTIGTGEEEGLGRALLDLFNARSQAGHSLIWAPPSFFVPQNSTIFLQDLGTRCYG